MRFPGLGGSPPAAPAAPPPPPTIEDPAVGAAKDKLRQSELLRRGRQASILNGGGGVQDTAPLGRPTATSGTGNSGTLG